MRIVFYVKNRNSPLPNEFQIFIDGVLEDIRFMDDVEYGWYGGKWSEDGTAYIIPDVPKDAVEIEDGRLTIREPKRESVEVVIT